MDVASDHQTFKVSLARFLARATPLRRIKSILCWENKTHSILVLLLYTLFCLYPLLFVVTPLATYLAWAYLNERKEMHDSRSDTPVTDHSKEQETGILPVLEFYQNLMFLQWLMDTYCHLQEKIQFLFSAPTRRHVDHRGVRVLVAAACTCALFMWLLVPRFVSWSYLWITVGWLIVCMSLILRTKEHQMGPQSLQTGHVPQAGHAIMELYENQRWWFGLGFQPLLFGDDRSSWSTQDGRVALPAKSAHPPRAGHAFAAPDWTLDTTWSATDDQGWVYTDHFWNHPSPSPRATSVTRTRKWIRPIQRIEENQTG